MSSAVPTFVLAQEPIPQAGVRAELRSQPQVRLVEEMAVDEAVVAVVVTGRVENEKTVG